MKPNPSNNKLFKVSRRDFVKIGALGSTGLILGVPLGCKQDKNAFLTGREDAVFAPNVYITILGTGEVQLIAHRSEMGTGIRTSLPLVMADEMEADWTKVKIIQAVGDVKYGDQNTDGSYSVRMFYQPLRIAGATVKLMLMQAAAQEWQVDISECSAVNHEIVHSSGKSLGYGYLAEKAGALPIPEENEITLKDSKDFKFISKETVIYDLEDIVTGKAVYGLDVQIPDLKVAVIKRNPEAGAGIKSFNSDMATAIEGVSKVYKMESTAFPMGYNAPLGGIVVVANNTWTALKALDTVEVVWDKGINASYDSNAFMQQMQRSVQKEGQVKRQQGSATKALKEAAKVIESDFLVPHLAHSPMETPCAVARYNADGTCEIWAPVQSPQWVRQAVAAALGIEESEVTINVTLLGSAFGRKSKPDFVVEAALISKEMNTPIKLLWTREDDIQHDFYHSNCAQHIKVGIDKNNKVTSWVHRTAFPSISGTASADAKGPSSDELCMGVLDMPFEIDNISCESLDAKAQIRIGWLRSVHNINHAFAIGSIVDQVAQAREMDPIDNMLDLLGSDRKIDFAAQVEGFNNYNVTLEEYPCDTHRLKQVIQLVKEKSGWGKSLPKGKGMGFAAHRSFLTYVACVVEVEVDDNNNIKIPMVHFAIDCGVPVNPDRIRAQFEGGAAFGASLALKSEINVKNGAVMEENFNNYLVARMEDAPINTAVHFVENEEKPTGVGEPPVPPFIPALCNAIFMATGKRITRLPIRL